MPPCKTCSGHLLLLRGAAMQRSLQLAARQLLQQEVELQAALLLRQAGLRDSAPLASPSGLQQLKQLGVKKYRKNASSAQVNSSLVLFFSIFCRSRGRSRTTSFSGLSTDPVQPARLN